MGFFTKKEPKTNGKKSLTPEQRADALAMYEQGEYKPSEIADELGVDVVTLSRLFDVEKRKIVRLQGGQASADDPIRQMNIEIKKAELEMKLQEKQWALEDREFQRKEDLAAMWGPEDGQESMNPMETMLMAVMQGIFQQRAENAPSGPSSIAAPEKNGAAQSDVPVAAIVLTDDVINEMLNQYPREVAILAKMPEEQQRQALQSRFPNVDTNSVTRALEILRERTTKTGEKKHGKKTIFSTLTGK